MPKKRSVEVRSLGGGKCEASVGSENGLAAHDGNGWILSPNLRDIPQDAMDALLKRLTDFDPIQEAKQS